MPEILERQGHKTPQRIFKANIARQKHTRKPSDIQSPEYISQQRKQEPYFESALMPRHLQVSL
jgi:hypothetical protein